MSTYTPISSFTATTSVSSVTIAGIPQTYTDLVVVIDGTTASTFTQLQVRTNGDTASNYSTTYLWGTGSAAVSDRDSNISTGGMNAGFLGTGQGNNTFHIQNYSNTTTYKTVLARSSVPGNRVAATVNLWRSTAAITELRFNLISAENFASGTTFNLYGIANASITNTAKATGGDSVTTDGTYWYHTFRSSGTFTPTQALTCDYAVVGGGGGGGSYFSTTFSFVSGAGGGGGGGVSSSNNSFASGTNYSVTIGAGATASYGTAGSGTASSLIGGALSITSNGGSGGGNGGPSTVGAGGTAGTGGGAGGSGGAYNNNGDSGSAGTNVTWSAYYGGGGGGGSGGLSNGTGGSGGSGGGGTGMDWESLSFNYAVLPGTANTGGGGGGATQPYPPTSNARKTGGNGGSGIVIIRYAV